MIGALVLPIMLSATFQDGSMIPPDVDGPARWWAYAAVGIVLALVYALASRRSAMYAYLVGPGLWAAVGAVGLFLEDGLRLVRSGGLGALGTPGGFTADGISAAQMVLVAVAIAATIPAASALRATGVGRRISAPLVRSALVALPFVVATAIVFAYSDAVLAGIAEPGLRDLAPAWMPGCLRLWSALMSAFYLERVRH